MQIGTLLAGTSVKNLPQMRNLCMELRKVCCHPYLCKGLEDNIWDRARASGASQLDLLVGASGKMVLLDKLLRKLRAEGRKASSYFSFSYQIRFGHARQHFIFTSLIIQT